MKLIDLLELTTDDTDIKIFDLWGNMAATYDGRDSIPTKYNNYQVDKIDGNGNGLEITLCFFEKEATKCD